MKKLLIIFFVCFGFLAKGQVFTPMTAAGYQNKRTKTDSTNYIPTFPGFPTLRSTVAQKQAAIAADSTNKLFYWYDPKTETWNVLGSGSGSTINIFNDTTILICSGTNNCDTFITNVTANYVSIFNDSTLIVCNTEGACDTININPTVFGVSVVSFTKNAAGDSIILTLSDNTRLAVKDSLGVGISTINIITDSSISICNFNSCDTFITTVNPQLVTILNDSTLLVCDTTNTCDTLHIPRTQFIQNLFDTTNIYNQIQNVYNYFSDTSFTNQFFPRGDGVLLDTVIRITDSTLRFIYTDGTQKEDTFRIALTQENITNITNIINYIDSLRGNDTTFILSASNLQSGLKALYSTTDSLSGNDTLHLEFPHNNISEDSVLTTDVDGDLKMKLVTSGGGGGGLNIYNSDSTLAGNRTVTMDNKWLSLNGGNVLIGTGTDDGHTLRVNGSISFNIGSDSTGDMFYRNNLGTFTRLPAPTGITKPVLGYTTIPTWQADSTGQGQSSGRNIYNTDSSLAGNRTVTMPSNRWISFNGGNFGIGATSASPASLLTLSRDMPLSTSIIEPADSMGMLLKTSSTAIASNSTSSPGIVMWAKGWNTTAGASQNAKFKLYSSSGSAASLLGNFYIDYSANDGAYTHPFQLVGPNGNLIILGTFVAGGSITGTTINGTNFIATRNVNNGTNYADNTTITALSGTTPTTVRSYYFNPTVSSNLGIDIRAFENTTGSVVLNSTSGSTSIGSSDTIVGAKLAVTSTTGGFLMPRMTKAQRDKIYGGFTGSITEDGTGGAAANNTYLRALTGGTGTGATASIVVVSNVVTSVTILEYGAGYLNGDVLSASIGSITGFTWTISAITAPAAGMQIYQTDNTPGLRVYNGTNWMRFTETAD